MSVESVTLSKFSSEQLIAWAKIEDDDEVQSNFSPSTDILVGSKKDVSIALLPGEEVTVRDIVVLGKLVFQCSDPNVSKSCYPKLIARDIIAAGKVSFSDINLECHDVLAQGKMFFLKDLARELATRLEASSQQPGSESLSGSDL